MLQNPLDVLSQFPVRKTKKQRLAFRKSVMSYLRALGYACDEEKGSFGSRNIIAGNLGTAKYLVTAHYDTCAAMPIPNLITPCSLGGFLGWQLLLVVLMFGISGLVGFLVYLPTQSFEIGYLAGYFALIALLLLMMFGPANRHNANDNTSGVVAVLEMAKLMPLSERSKVCFVLFDLEEAGLIGSSSFVSKHKKQCRDKLVLNLDCVGDGDDLLFFPSKKVKKDAVKMQLLKKCAGEYGEKRLTVHEKGFSIYPSDQKCFPLGVGICALKSTKKGLLYMDKIHTKKDTNLDETNVHILCAAISSMICCDAV